MANLFNNSFNTGFGTDTRKQQTSQIQGFVDKFSPKPKVDYSKIQGMMQPGLQSMAPNPSLSTGTSQGGVKTANNVSLTQPSAPLANQQVTSQNIGSIMSALAPYMNPASVDINVGDKIPADALNTEPSFNKTSEKNKKLAAEVNYSKEEERLLKDIEAMYSGIADLSATQAREYYNLKQNPEGVFGSGVLNSQLGRLSEEQAIELNARTGQLNAMLDTMEMYQGYRPQIVGTPQIDEATGQAYAYLQDPMTGEVSVQDLGQIMTPGGTDSFGTVSAGSSIYDKSTGQIIGSAPGGVSAGGVDTGVVNYYADMLGRGVISLSNVPQNIRNSVVAATQGNVNKTMSTGEITKITEAQTGIDNLASLRLSVVNSPEYFGPLGGLKTINPLDSKGRGIVAEINAVKQFVGKALEGGVLRKEDEEKYKKILPTRFDTDETALIKIDQLTQMIQRDINNFQMGLQQGGRYTGETQEKDWGKIMEEAWGQ